MTRKNTRLENISLAGQPGQFSDGPLGGPYTEREALVLSEHRGGKHRAFNPFGPMVSSMSPLLRTLLRTSTPVIQTLQISAARIFSVERRVGILPYILHLLWPGSIVVVPPRLRSLRVGSWIQLPSPESRPPCDLARLGTGPRLQ
jgi:hypothetical protein